MLESRPPNQPRQPDPPSQLCQLRGFDRGDLELLSVWLQKSGLGVPQLAPDQLARRLMQDPAILCFTACQAGQPVGFIRFDLSPDHAAEVTLIVRPDQHRRGVGRSMLDQAIEMARQRGWQRLWALVRAENTAALRLFESVGFIEADNRLPGYAHLLRLVHRRPAGMVAPLEISP